MKFRKNKNLLLLAFTILGTFLINIKIAKATILGDVARDLLQGLFFVLLNIAQAFTGFVGNVFSGVLNFGFQNLGPIQIGWEISRDIVNTFFILGLIVIAFATILRFEQYGIKKLLPKFIVIALLINFSFIIGGIIIDISQIITNYFTDLIKTDIGGAIVETVGATDALREQPIQTVGIGTENPENITILTMAFTAAVVFITGFVLLIGAVLLIIRIGALWALLILAPFAWFFSIFPGLKTHASKWWSEFFKWSFFAPIYVFFIYLIIRIGEVWVTEMSNRSISIPSPDALGQLTYSSMFQSMDMFFKFIFLIILLFGAPTIAMSMGIKSAGIVTSRVKGVFRGTGRFVGRRVARRPADIGARMGAGVMKGTGKVLQIIPGLKRLGRRVESTAMILREKPLDAQLVKKQRERVKRMSDSAKVQDVKAQPAGALRLATIEESINALKKTDDRGAILLAIDTLKAYGRMKEATELKQARFSVIKKDPERAEEYKKLKAKGVHKEIRPEAFKDRPGEIAGQNAVKTVIQNEVTISDLLKVIKEMRTDTQEQFGKSLLPIIKKDNSFSEENKKQRSAYAAITGKIHVAFTNADTGKIEDSAMGEFVRNMKPQNFADIDKDSIKHIAKHIEASDAGQIARHISGEMRKEFARYFRDDVKKDLATDDRWKSYIAQSENPNVVDLKERITKEAEEKRKEASRKAQESMKETPEKTEETEEEIMEKERKKAEGERPK